MDRHSRLVALLKVVLPLMALGLLSTLFLLSRSIDPETAIPFAKAEIEDRINARRITEPFFSGATAQGDTLSLSAATIGFDARGLTRATDVMAELVQIGGTRVTMNAAEAEVNPQTNAAKLSGGILINTASGFDITTHRIEADLSSALITAPGQISARGPFGNLEAGKMILRPQNGDEQAQMVFTNRVKLIYTPE